MTGSGREELEARVKGTDTELDTTGREETEVGTKERPRQRGEAEIRQAWTDRWTEK